MRRNSKGRFDKVTDVGKSLAADQRHHSSHEPPKGKGDKGDKGDRKKAH